MPENIYFELTDVFNAKGRVAILASGQAVVYYRLAVMSKDGDWIVRETDDACGTILEALRERAARYRVGAPLDPRWLRGGWSSHFELTDERGRRIRCDFFSRPPRIPANVLEGFFDEESASGELPVVDVESLIRMKQTQRAKDYPVIGELARRMPSEREIELTTDPDRVLELAPGHGAASDRPAIRAAREDRGRLAVVLALAEEADRLQQLDRERMRRYELASADFVRAVHERGREALGLPDGHRQLCELAERLLPETLEDMETTTSSPLDPPRGTQP